MKKLFFLTVAFLASITLCAETETFTWVANGGTALSGTGAESGFAYTTQNFTIENKKGTASSAPANDKSELRLYKYSTLSFIGGNSVKSITKLKFVMASTYYAWDDAYTVLTPATGATINADSTITITGDDVKTVTIQRTGGATRFSAIVIEYVKAAATEPTISTLSNVDFPAVLDASRLKVQTLDVAGELLAVNPTYSLKNNTAFKVEGALEKTGGKLTITCSATATGTYTDVLTITAGTATKEVTLGASILSSKSGAKGTKDSPLTVDDVITLANQLDVTEKYWVKGVILGSVQSSNNKPAIAKTYSDDNLALGDAKGATDIIGVALPDGEAKTALNLVANSKNLNATVKVCGTLESYYSGPGVKNVLEYAELVLDSESTALENTTAETVKARKIMENGQVYILRDGVRYTILGTLAE